MQYNKRKSELELRASLLELCNSEALCRKNNYYLGNKELFEDMLHKSEELDRVSSPRV
jgi:hypothetical protein